MIPRPCTMDAQCRAEDLASSILSSSSPPSIAAAISSVDAFLTKPSADNSRAFFSAAFPALICRLFGFDESPASASTPTAWIDQVLHEPDLAGRLFDLLAPHGPLISAVSSTDRHGLVMYVFPTERLPGWMALALQSERHSSILPDLCPIFRGRVKEDPKQRAFQLQLNAFEYYMFWFAYYPVCRCNAEGSDGGLLQKRRHNSMLEKWASSLPRVLGSHGRRSEQKKEVNLYIRLFYAYLCAFVPDCGLGSYQPYRSSLLQYSSSFDSSAFVQAEFLVYSLIHFWLVDSDFLPLSSNAGWSFGISPPSQSIQGEMPRNARFWEVLKLFVKYMNICLVAPAGGDDYKALCLADAGPRLSMASLENSVGFWNSVIQRPLYRFLLRTFVFCPNEASLKIAAQAFKVWVTYMEPWRTSPDDFGEFGLRALQKIGSSRKETFLLQGNNSEEKERRRTKVAYKPQWEGYVASNYLFYSSMVVHFLGFAHKFLHTNVETVVQMVSKVLDILASSRELMDFLRKVDCAYYHLQTSRPYPALLGCVDKCATSIGQQLKDWEDGLYKSNTGGENWKHGLKLFSNGEHGAYNLLQLFVLRTDDEIQAMSGDSLRCRQALDSIKSQMNMFFGSTMDPSRPFATSSREEHILHYCRGEMFIPKHPGVGKQTWADVKYKGDWMHRPISDTEVACLTRTLIGLSDWLNGSLGLDRVDDSEPSRPTNVELDTNNSSPIRGPKEAAVILITLIASWLWLFGQSVLRFMRGHGVRINLRVFASKKIMRILVIYAIICALKKAFCIIGR